MSKKRKSNGRPSKYPPGFRQDLVSLVIDEDHEIAEDELGVLIRDFYAESDVAWCQDITYIPTGKGWMYMASLLDLGSRRLIGSKWLVDASPNRECDHSGSRVYG